MKYIRQNKEITKKPKVETIKVVRTCISTLGDLKGKAVCGESFIADGRWHRLCPRCTVLARVYG